ncbi:MAG: type VI secretion system membrane subunit TssM, partial [Mesorhizobium sp.]
SAMDEVANARTPPPGAAQDLLGPSASAELVRAQTDTYDHALRNVLEPHMVALLEATMWRQIRDPDFMLGALKTYRMMTGLSQMDPDFAQDWWVNRLPEFAAAAPFPTADAEEHQLAAIRRMAVDASYIAPDQALVAEALKTVCT